MLLGFLAGFLVAIALVIGLVLLSDNPPPKMTRREYYRRLYEGKLVD